MDGRVSPADPETGLVVAGDVESENAKDWGFCDAVFKSGNLLFPSVLKLRVARRMEKIFEASGEFSKAEAFRRGAARIGAAFEPSFLHLSSDRSEAWLHSATGVGNQPDV